MAFSENPEIRKKLDFGYSYNNQVIELFETRPVWNNPKEIQNVSFETPSESLEEDSENNNLLSAITEI